MTTDEKKKIYAALSAPFPEEAIERTDGRVTGRGYSTTGIKAQYVINRLNDVVGLGNWRLHREIAVRELTTNSGRKMYEAVADVALELGCFEDGKFVPFAETVADGGHSSTSEADAKKGAASNGLKKAAAMFGCGRQAYEGTLDDDNTPAESAPEEIRSSSVPPAQAPHQEHRISQPTIQTTSPAAPPPLPSQTPSRNRLTSKQLAALWAIARKLGHDQSQFRQSIKAQHGVQPEFLSRELASKLIGEMSAKLGNGHASQQFEERQVGQEG